MKYELRHVSDSNGIAWATPLADGLALIVSALLVLPYLLKMKKTCSLPKNVV